MENIVTSVFVYGTLRSSFAGEMQQCLRDHFLYAGDAKVRGILYMGEYPVAVKSVNETFIAGELYRLKQGKEFSEAIRQLDEYEEVDQDREKSLYLRELSEVIFNGYTVTAWMYWYNKPILSERLIASGDILNRIVITNKP